MSRSAPIRGLLLALLVLACLPAFGAPQPRIHKKDAKHEVEELEQQWRSATLSADVTAMDKLLSEDYVGISMTGQVNTKVQQLDRLRTRTLNLTTIALSDMKVKLVGPIAIVTGLASVDGTSEGAPIQGSYRYTRIYQRLSSGSWKITNFEVTRIPKNRPGL